MTLHQTLLKFVMDKVQTVACTTNVYDRKLRLILERNYDRSFIVLAKTFIVQATGGNLGCF
jgi:hypothetical protein